MQKTFPPKMLALSTIFAVILLSLFSLIPLLSPGFFTLHDNQQITRLFELHKSLNSGQFPVRWVEGLGFGYGYPLFNFYPPLVYYLGETFHLFAGAGFVDSTKLVWASALVGSALAMYFLAKQFYGRLGGLLAAAFYLYAPYHAVDAYVRGALAELFSFVWLPLILLSAYKLALLPKRNDRIILAQGVLLGLLMITHNLVFLPFFAFTFLWYVAIVAAQNRRRILPQITYFALSTLLCFGLTAFFALPALVEKQYTLVDQLLIKNLASYKIHFVCLPQLWDSPWGFAGSASGCIDGLSFKIGKLHLLMTAVSAFVAAYLWLKNNRKLALTLLIAHCALLISIFMTTPLSAFIWDNFPPLWYLQFPWRFLEFAVLFSSLLAPSFLLVKTNGKLADRVKYLIALALIAAVILTNSKYFLPQKYLPDVEDSSELSDRAIKWTVSATSFEYLPKGFATKLTTLGTVWVDLQEKDIRQSDFAVRSGEIEVKSSHFYPDRFKIAGQSLSDSLLQVQITNFPGWTVWLNDRRVETDDNNKYKLITVHLPPGDFVLSGKFVNTPVRTLGNALSLISIFVIIILYGTRRSLK